MAIATSCQIDGAIFETHIEPTRVSVVVLHASRLAIPTKEEAELLEANIHNAMELVLKPYWKER